MSFIKSEVDNTFANMMRTAASTWADASGYDCEADHRRLHRVPPLGGAEEEDRTREHDAGPEFQQKRANGASDGRA